MDGSATMICYPCISYDRDAAASYHPFAPLDKEVLLLIAGLPTGPPLAVVGAASEGAYDTIRAGPKRLYPKPFTYDTILLIKTLHKGMIFFVGLFGTHVNNDEFPLQLNNHAIF